MRQIKIIIEKHEDGYVAYPLGVSGVVVGKGDTYEEAMADVKSTIAFHIETFGPGVAEVWNRLCLQDDEYVKRQDALGIRGGFRRVPCGRPDLQHRLPRHLHALGLPDGCVILGHRLPARPSRLCAAVHDRGVVFQGSPISHFKGASPQKKMNIVPSTARYRRGGAGSREGILGA